MVATVVINQANVIQDGQNNKLVYNFPSSVAFPNHEIAVQSVVMYYSWQNINISPLTNSLFQYQWVVGATATTYNVNIPSGQYEISDINLYLQFIMIQNGHFLINASGFNVYYAQLEINASVYSVQLNTYPVPTAAGWTLGVNGQWTGNVGTAYEGWKTPLANTVNETGGWGGFPTQFFNPSVIFPSKFNTIVGFPAGFASGLFTGIDTNQSWTSSEFGLAPQVQPNSSIYLAITNIQNKYATPSSILYAINPTVAFGMQIIEKPPQFAFNKLIAGTYNQLSISILGADFQPINLLDANMTIILVIRDQKEITDIFSTLVNGK